MCSNDSLNHNVLRTPHQKRMPTANGIHNKQNLEKTNHPTAAIALGLRLHRELDFSIWSQIDGAHVLLQCHHVRSVLTVHIIV